MPDPGMHGGRREFSCQVEYSMGIRQSDFLERFKRAFEDRFPEEVAWSGGQGAANTAGLVPDPQLRRKGKLRSRERFELGDLRCDFRNTTVIVEFDSEPVAVHNLVKYWPYIRGELDSVPTSPIVLCHFSNWSSYGSYRDLWKWLIARIGEDRTRKVEFQGRQFDHGGSDRGKEAGSVSEALAWLADVVP